MRDSFFHLSTQNYYLAKTQCCCVSEDRRGQGNAEMQKHWLMEQSVRAHISVSQVYHSNIGPICDVTNFLNSIKDIIVRYYNNNENIYNVPTITKAWQKPMSTSTVQIMTSQDLLEAGILQTPICFFLISMCKAHKAKVKWCKSL